MAAKRDPWAGLVDFDTPDQPSQQAMGTDAAAAIAPPANDTAATDPWAGSVDFSNEGNAGTEDDASAAHASAIAEAQVMFDRGAGHDELSAFLTKNGITPNDSDLAAAIRYRDKGGKGAMIASPTEGATPVPYGPQEGIGSNADGATGAFLRGLVDIPTLGLLDEAGGVVDTLGLTPGRENVWNSDKGFTDLLDQNIDLNRDILHADEAEHPVARIAGQLLGGLAIPTGLEGVGLKAGTEALKAGASMREARAIAATAVRNRMMATGAAAGAAYGAGSAEGGVGERAIGAGIGAGLGAATGGLIGGAGELAQPLVTARRAAARAAPPSENIQFSKAAERQGIDYLPADRPNALPSQWATALTNLTLGGIPLTEAAAKVVATAKAARDRIAAGVGLVADETGAGQAAQKGLKSWMGQSGAKGDQLYSAIPIAGDRPAELINTRAALAELTAGLSSNPKLSALVEDPKLKAFADALDAKSGRGLNWRDLMAFRSYVGEKAGQPTLQSDTSKAALKRLYAGLSDDMRMTAQAEGPKAFKAWKRANDYWRGRSQRIENVVTSLLGKDMDKGGDATFAAIERLANTKGGDPIKLAQTLRTMPADEANTVRASIIGKMGQASAGRQDASGEIFSPAEFVTQWNKLSDRAKGILFQGDHAKAMDDIARVYAGMKASSRYANTSKTGIAVAATANVGLAAHSLIDFGLSAAAQFGAGKLLGSPAFAKWLAGLGQKPNPVAALAHINNLTKIARAEPAIANDVLGLQQRLAEAFSQGPHRVAASDDTTDSEQTR